MKNVYEINGYGYEKLYNCQARVNKNGLVSYNTATVIIDEQSNKVIMNLYHSRTTMSHVRKYIEYLLECNKRELAYKVDACYRVCITNHLSHVEWHDGAGIMICE